MTSMLSSRPSVSKPHDNSVKREQNPHYSDYNGLIVDKAVWDTVHESLPPLLAVVDEELRRLHGD